jgi:RNA polymerase sigma factor (sigma-70 family)
MATSEPDLILLRRFKDRGDAEAFAEIVRRYTGAVFASCYRILHDPGAAEDAAQETFYRLMTRPQRVDSSLGGWLHRAATRLALDIRRSDTSRRRREAAYHAPEPAEASTWADVAPKLDEAIAALPEAHRELLVRHFLKGEPQADLATEVRTSPATLSRRIKAAVDALRRELIKRGLSVTPGVLFVLMSRNGVATAPAGLKLSLGKMALFCTARSATGASAGKLTLTGMLRSLPRVMHSARWAAAAAAFSVGVAFTASVSLKHVQLGPVSSGSMESDARTERSVAVVVDPHSDSHLVAQPLAGEVDEHVFQRGLAH